MSKVMSTLRRVLGIALAWAVLWGAFWAVIGVIIRIVDPDSIDPGDTAGMVGTLGPMGFFSGVAFGTLLAIARRGRTTRDLSVTDVAGWGILGSAIVQLAYLDHGDLGLADSINMALFFCAFGAVVTMVWLAVARGWSHWRSSVQSSS